MILRSLIVSILLAYVPRAMAHVGHHPSVHDTVAGIIERMRTNLSVSALRTLDQRRVESLLTTAERQILSTEHLSFRVNAPVTVWILQEDGADAPFWLSERGFRKQSVDWSIKKKKLSAWNRSFPAGWIGLGVNSLTGGGTHYLVLLEPSAPGLELTDVYPGQLRTTPLKTGARLYVDRDEEFEAIPDRFHDFLLLQTQHRQRDDARLLNVFRFTDYPATAAPDQVILTWSGDPKTTQSIQWRTSTNVAHGMVRYLPKSALNPLAPRPLDPLQVAATTEPLETKFLVNDPAVHRHTAVLTGLAPGTTYVYSVGHGEHWSPPAEFSTAPEGVVPFSFVYMGDAQNGLDRWGSLLNNAFRSRPDAAFYIMAGDLVNRGADRDDWDSFFHNSRGVYHQRQLVPALGNHECQGGHPTLYLKQFDLPRNGPKAIEEERAYAFEYSNALFIVLDSNSKPADQTAWLDEQLARTRATWKFVIYHHPAYSSAPNRDNTEIRDLWTPIFDKYHVDLALQGHDHAYLRTYPMKGKSRIATAAEGTIYIVSVSGTKMYKLDERDYTEFGMSNVSTYQVLDIQISGDRLVYRAWDIDGNVRDELIIEK